MDRDHYVLRSFRHESVHVSVARAYPDWQQPADSDRSGPACSHDTCSCPDAVPVQPGVLLHDGQPVHPELTVQEFVRASRYKQSDC